MNSDPIDHCRSKGNALKAPPVLKASDQSVNYTCGQCGVFCCMINRGSQVLLPFIAISHAAAIPHPPIGRSNSHHSVQTHIDPAHSIAPAGKRQYVVFLALVNA